MFPLCFKYTRKQNKDKTSLHKTLFLIKLCVDLNYMYLIYFNIILQSTHVYAKWTPTSRTCDQDKSSLYLPKRSKYTT